MTPLTDIHTHNPQAGGIAIRSHRMGIGEPVPLKPFSEGIHPWDASLVAEPLALVQELRNDPIIAVGEIGLDRLHPDIPLQTELFRRQLIVAHELDLPVIIHCVKAFEDVMSELHSVGHKKIIFHGYTGSGQQTKRVYDEGYYISLGKVSLGSARTITGLKGFPVERMFLETDDSGLEIAAIYRQASIALDIGMEKLTDIMYSNYKELFGE